MALRDKLRDRVAPHLDEGEEVQAVFMGQTGPNPMWILVTWLILVFGSKYRVIAVTNRGTRTFSSSMWMPAKPKESLALHAHEGIEPHGGVVWHQAAINGENMWVHKRFAKDILAANDAMGL